MAKSKIDPESILERAKSRPMRSKASFTFDTALYARFSAYCKKKDVPISRMLEELMRVLLESEE